MAEGISGGIRDINNRIDSLAGLVQGLSAQMTEMQGMLEQVLRANIPSNPLDAEGSPWLSTNQAAHRLGYSPTWVKDQIRAGKIPPEGCIKRGKGWYIHADSLPPARTTKRRP